MANPTTNYGWPMPTSTDLVTDLPADFAAFGQPVDTSLKALNPETTLGDIAYRSATANTNTRLGIGTNGQVLAVSGGVPAWTTASSGALTLIRRASYSSVADTGTTFDGVFTSTYRGYLVNIETNFAATATDDMQLLFRYSAASQTSAYFSSSTALTSAATVINTVVNNGAASTLHYDSGSGTTYPVIATMYFNNIGNGSSRPGFYGQGYNAGGTPVMFSFGGLNDTARSYDGFLIKSSSTNITGTISVYGLAIA